MELWLLWMKIFGRLIVKDNLIIRRRDRSCIWLTVCQVDHVSQTCEGSCVEFLSIKGLRLRIPRQFSFLKTENDPQTTVQNRK